MPSPDFFHLFIAPLNRTSVRYMVTGSVAAMLYGEPRFTNDVDVILFLLPNQVDSLQTAFPTDQYYLPPPEVIRHEALRPARGHLNIVHHETGLRADIYLPGHSELEAWAIRHVRTLTVDDIQVPLAPPEYVIVKKLEFFKEGQSSKHLADIKSILTHTSEIDRQFITEAARARGIEPEWGRAQENAPSPL